MSANDHLDAGGSAPASGSDEKLSQFPRTKDIPKQSPLFWVEQKDRYLRQLLIRDIEEITGRRLLVYFTNRFQNALIDQRDASYMAELLSDAQGHSFDLLIESPGGFTDAAESLISIIKNCSSDFRAIVANAAKSNGTLLCLASSEIIMGPTSQLGPIDPHLNNVPATILAQPQVAQQNFVLHQAAQYALSQTKKLAEDLLLSGMLRSRPAEVKAVVEKLSTRDHYFSHGSVIDHSEAASLGLNIKYLPQGDELWSRIWLLYCMYDYDCRRDNLLKIYEGRRTSAAIAAPEQKTV